MNIPDDGLIIGSDNKSRCWWHGDIDEYIKYHDEEWGCPVNSDRQLFEKIILEGFQSGLSWLTILRKRENFRNAFDNFNYKKIVKYSDTDIERLVKDVGIIRHRGKIVSTINNAARVQEIIKEYGSFSAYIWQYEPKKKDRPTKINYKTLSQITQSAKSVALSKDLKKRGWSFVGPTTCYAFMQSMGIVNDHIEGCCCRDRIEEERKKFERPI